MKYLKKPLTWVILFALIVGFAVLIEQVQHQKTLQAFREIDKYQEERDQHEQELIQAAKNTSIGDGVTLDRGVRAYCGTDVNWSAFNETIFLEAYGDTHWIEAAFKQNEETGLLDVVGFDSDLHPSNKMELDSIISDMISAANMEGTPSG